MESAANTALDSVSQSRRLEALKPQERVAWAIDQFGEGLILSSSFGAQAAVCLHMVTTLKPDVPVVLIDTGYLFPETYRFIDELTKQLSLNLRVYRSHLSPAWQEARYGNLWEQGGDGIRRYNQLNKVEPMKRALAELQATGWIAGIRRAQSKSREAIPVLTQDGDCVKIHPIIDWTDRDVFYYLKKHDLPYHPLWYQNYLSIGDVHTTQRVEAGMLEEDARFFGLRRECGLHEGVNTDFSI
ncbi:MAG: Phosphoadenosine phosphosulfate reductase [Verrucomicrobia subdivision 3 bacterium]|nr:Phosphoadenosine phosphosulfate reductase [Limisphaerales bacterium]MCS1414187.1 Phosphoadenosine phosphosulfate reductase [Limisphaerales bacterium]